MAPSGPGTVRQAADSDFGPITAIAMATGQDEDWDQVYPAYLRHLVTHGILLVAERADVVTGYGATVRIGAGSLAVSMLTDLFVDPREHGGGVGRLEPAGGLARVCLPAPHPATRSLLRAGWKVEEFDLYMASEPGLLNPRRAALSAALA